MSLTPEQRVLRARIAAFASHVKYAPGERTAHLRSGLEASFVRKVRERWPELTDEQDIARRAEILRREHFARLSFAASRARATRPPDRSR